MSTVEFIYKGTTIDIPCKEEDKLEEIIQKFSTKMGKKLMKCIIFTVVQLLTKIQPLLI